MTTVRFGVVGLGSIGSRHAAYLNNLAGGKLAAVCDAHVDLANRIGGELKVPAFQDYRPMLASQQIDAVLIATPHFQHPPIALAAFDAGVHVLCEKPLAVSVKQAQTVIDAAAKKPNLKFGLMFQQRTWPIYSQAKQLLSSGEMGEILRVTWTITDWFRTNAYYASGGWRATWDGEGGGVLLNQCPHNLDLLWWLTMLKPKNITAIAKIGATHPIEVEDEVAALLEYDGSAIGQFITSTGEAPGSNRLEIATDRGLLIAEPGRLTVRRTEQSVRELRQTGPANVRVTPTVDKVHEFGPEPRDAHKQITQNFIDAILKGDPLIAPGADGVHGLEIGNAILMAGLTRRSVSLPLDADAYEDFLTRLASQSPGKKQTSAA